MKQFFLMIAFTSFSAIACAQVTAGQAFEFEAPITTDNADNVRLHIFYSSLFSNYQFFTSLQEDPIKLKPRSYVLLESEEEIIDFFRNTAVNDMPVRLKFERGKDYYFRISRSVDDAWDINIDEMTERAFQMEIFISNASPKPEVYSFPAKTNLN